MQPVKLGIREVLPCPIVERDVYVPALQANEKYEPFIIIFHTPVFQFGLRTSSHSVQDCIGEELLPVQDFQAPRKGMLAWTISISNRMG